MLGPGPGIVEVKNTAPASTLVTDHCRVNGQLQYNVMSTDANGAARTDGEPCKV